MSKKIEAFKHVHTIDYQIVEGRLNYDDAVPLEMLDNSIMNGIDHLLV